MKKSTSADTLNTKPKTFACQVSMLFDLPLKKLFYISNEILLNLRYPLLKGIVFWQTQISVNAREQQTADSIEHATEFAILLFSVKEMQARCVISRYQ